MNLARKRKLKNWPQDIDNWTKNANLKPKTLLTLKLDVLLM